MNYGVASLMNFNFVEFDIYMYNFQADIMRIKGLEDYGLLLTETVGHICRYGR